MSYFLSSKKNKKLIINKLTPKNNELEFVVQN